MKTKLKKAIQVTAVAALATALFAGCAGNTFTQNAYNTLNTTKIGYEVAMKSSAELYKSGKLTEQQKETIITAGNTFRETFLVAVEAFETYENTKGLEGKEALTVALEDVLSYYNQLSELVNHYLELLQ